MSHIHWVVRQNKQDIPRDKDEVNNREINEVDGWVHDPDTMVVPLTPKPIVKPRPSKGIHRPLSPVVKKTLYWGSGHHHGTVARAVFKKTVVYCSSRKRELKTRPIYECRCDERLWDLYECCLLLIDKSRSKDKTYVWVSVRCRSEDFCLLWINNTRVEEKTYIWVSVWCSYTLGCCLLWIDKTRLKTRPVYECRCDERLKTKAEESTRLAYTWLLVELGWSWNWNT
jgi:hypothetical protein